MPSSVKGLCRPDRLYRLYSLLLTISGVALSGCKDLTSAPDLPAGTHNPAFYNTKAGALGMRNAAVLVFEQALPVYVLSSGLLTDELEDPSTGASAGLQFQHSGVVDSLDERILPETGGGGAEGAYDELHHVRAEANLALGALATYDTAPADRKTQHILRGELFALEGYAEIMLADLFCSGVPLSTLDFQHDFTYQPSSTTAAVYEDALAKLDSAVRLADTSTQVQNLARVGRGRAWLDLGRYDSAAAAVAQVPSTFQYVLTVLWPSIQNFLAGNDIFDNSTIAATISDREGSTGMPYRSSGDPRTAVDTVDTLGGNGQPLPTPFFFPVKYATAALSDNGYSPFVVADGIEARLIQAEAAFHGVATGQGSWLDQLNALRQTAITPALPTLTDPGTDAARVSLLFHERAYWLFLTGHRQGDLRRLLRQYAQFYRTQAQVYPTGPYLAPGTGFYGTDVTVPIPAANYVNHLFHGCLDRAP